MTRTALRAAIPQRIVRLLVLWFADRSKPFPRALKRAGYDRLPDKLCGVEREVVIGPRVVVKTTGWRSISPAASRYRRARTLCPTIELAKTLVAQPKGRVFARLPSATKDRLDARLTRAENIVESRYNIGDTHDWNFALFPDGTIRHIDY